MFIFGSKQIAGGLRIGAGLRMTKRNFMWMAIILMCVGIIRFLYFITILTLWAMYYIMVWPFVKLYQVIKRATEKRQQAKLALESEIHFPPTAS